MRAVGCAIVIIAALIVMIVSGVGQGLNACLANCRMDHCHGYEKDLDKNCVREDYEPCKDACYAEHGEE